MAGAPCDRVGIGSGLSGVAGACTHTGTLPSKTLRETALALSGLRARSGRDPRGRILREPAKGRAPVGSTALRAGAEAPRFDRRGFHHPALGDPDQEATDDALLTRAAEPR